MDYKENIFQILNEARNVSNVDVSDYEEQFNNTGGPNWPDVELDDRGSSNWSMTDAVSNIANDENRPLEDRAIAAAILDSSYMSYLTDEDPEKDAHLYCNIYDVANDIDYHREMIQEHSEYEVFIAVRPYDEIEMEYGFATDNKEYSICVNKDREHIYDILNEAKENSSSDNINYKEQYQENPESDILIDNRGGNDWSFINVLSDIANDEERNLEDRSVAAAILMNSYKSYDVIDEEAFKDDRDIDYDDKSIEDVEIESANTYLDIDSAIDDIEHATKMIESGSFDISIDVIPYDYNIEEYLEPVSEHIVNIGLNKDIGKEFDFYLNEALAYVSHEQGFDDFKNKGEVSFMDYDDRYVINDLVELASNPDKDENLRTAALSLAMSTICYSDVNFDDDFSSSFSSTINRDDAIKHIQEARDIISNDRIVEIDVHNINTNTSNFKFSMKEEVFQKVINSPTVEQISTLNSIGGYDVKMNEYFSEIDQNTISSSMLKEKMDLDPDVIKYRDDISHQIENQSTFSNDHIIIFDRGTYGVSSPVLDLPSGKNYDICIELLGGNSYNREISITCNRDFNVAMDKAINEMSDKLGINVSHQSSDMGMNSYSFDFITDEDMDSIKEIMFDVAYEYNHSFENEHDLDIDVSTPDI